ncbi:MAG: site-2 protease family protein [Clostridiales bacterium]|nr:site-2 protease family protein [Clostridiales bacterium]
MLTIPVHEFAHAFVAVKCGDNTPKYSGRYTLNPLKHFDPLGLLMMALVRFGWAKPVPINPANFKNQRRGVLLVSVAGPLSNLFVAFISYPLFLLSVLFLPDIMLFDDLIRTFFSVMVGLNVSLFLFNLLPIFPLDGFHILETCFKRDNAFLRFLRQYGSYILLGLILIGIFADSFSVLNYVDLLGLYLNTCGNFIFRILIAFWGIFF